MNIVLDLCVSLTSCHCTIYVSCNVTDLPACPLPSMYDNVLNNDTGSHMITRHVVKDYILFMSESCLSLQNVSLLHNLISFLLIFCFNLLHFHIFLDLQLWGIIKQGYKCKGKVYTLTYLLVLYVFNNILQICSRSPSRWVTQLKQEPAFPL